MNASIIRFIILTLTVCLSSCSDKQSNTYQGYVDADFLYLASPFGGTLKELAVDRGKWVKEGDFLFQLDDESQRAAETEAKRLLDRARATFEDSKKGLRPSELAAIEARFSRGQAESTLAEKEVARLKALESKNYASANDLDRAETSLEAKRKAVDELKAQLDTGKLGARLDQIIAAEAQVAASEAALQKAAWATAQQRANAPRDALIFDSLFRPGEFVAAGRPVLSLLAPAYLKIRFFIPEKDKAFFKQGVKLSVAADGLKEALSAHVNYIAPEAEYTPPVIYSREQREKLVYLIEARFEAASGIPLPPGQPVDVRTSE